MLFYLFSTSVAEVVKLISCFFVEEGAGKRYMNQNSRIPSPSVLVAC